MARTCAGCGAEAHRTRTTFRKDGATEEICPSCRPAEFSEAHRDPSDNRIWMGPEVYPTLYKRDAAGKYHAKDELISDTVALMRSDPDEEKKKAWRAMREKTRRVRPMTEDEIREAKTGPLAKSLEQALEAERKELHYQDAIQRAAREAATASEQPQ